MAIFSISNDPAHAQIGFRLQRKHNQMNFERKTSQNQFSLILSETQDQKLEKNLPDVFKLEAISILAIRNQTQLLTIPVRYNSHF